MQNLSGKLAILTLAACGFGLTQTALAGDRFAGGHPDHRHVPYTMPKYGHPRGLSRDDAAYGHAHRHTHNNRYCRDYGRRHDHTPGRYDGHRYRYDYGYGRSGYDRHAYSQAERRRPTDYRDRPGMNTAYAKGSRY
jgi:hypothetical protein